MSSRLLYALEDRNRTGIFTTLIHILYRNKGQNVVAHVYNLSTWKDEAGV